MITSSILSSNYILLSNKTLPFIPSEAAAAVWLAGQRCGAPVISRVAGSSPQVSHFARFGEETKRKRSVWFPLKLSIIRTLLLLFKRKNTFWLPQRPSSSHLFISFLWNFTARTKTRGTERERTLANAAAPNSPTPDSRRLPLTICSPAPATRRSNGGEG